MVPLYVGVAIGAAGELFGWPLTDQLIIYAATVMVWALADG